MCGRFSITGDLDFYAEYFAVDEVVTKELEKSWNVAPTDPIYVIAEHEGVRQLGAMKWGLVPHWAKDTRSIHINSRVETVATNNTFRESFARRRLLIPADGFYEWDPPEDGRNPHWVYRADGFPMVFAGIWASRHDPATDEWHKTCSIITTAAEGTIATIHDRMPLRLDPGVWDGWLDRQLTDPEIALGLIGSPDTADIMEHPVSKDVNSVRNNAPHLHDRALPETLF